jgi:hypothetical protein
MKAFSEVGRTGLTPPHNALRVEVAHAGQKSLPVKLRSRQKGREIVAAGSNGHARAGGSPHEIVPACEGLATPAAMSWPVRLKEKASVVV